MPASGRKQRGMAILDSARRLFFGELIDDAGVFPPAALDMEAALHRHLQAHIGAESWMLHCFLVPASRLHELARNTTILAEIMRVTGKPLPVSAVSDCPDPRVDYTATAEFIRSDCALVEVRSLEVRIPRIAVVDGAARVHSVLQKLEDAELSLDIAVFIEMPDDAQPIVAEAMEMIAAQRTSARGMLHAKLRCGGAIPSLTPDTKDIAFFLAQACKRQVPFKVTGGLHAPIRHTDRATGLASHGFLNVLGAAMLASAFNWDTHTITHMLYDEQAENFHLDDRCFQWKEYMVNPLTIFDARTALVRSLGSCSLSEPIEGLRALGMLHTSVR
jgi:hypothetical protein